MAGPGMLRADAVVAFHAALREVATTHVPKLHPPSLLHGNTITLVSTCGDTGVTEKKDVCHNISFDNGYNKHR